MCLSLSLTNLPISQPRLFRFEVAIDRIVADHWDLDRNLFKKPKSGVRVWFLLGTAEGLFKGLIATISYVVAWILFSSSARKYKDALKVHISSARYCLLGAVLSEKVFDLVDVKEGKWRVGFQASGLKKWGNSYDPQKSTLLEKMPIIGSGKNSFKDTTPFPFPHSSVADSSSSSSEELQWTKDVLQAT